MTCRTVLCSFLLLGSFCLTGCKSAFIHAVTLNETGVPITVLEVDYPSASYGANALPVGGKYICGFKIQGSGGTTVTWIDPNHQTHTFKGPQLHQGQGGTITVHLEPNAVNWDLTLLH